MKTVQMGLSGSTICMIKSLTKFFSISNMTDALARAVSLAHLVYTALEDGGRLFVIDKNGTRYEFSLAKKTEIVYRRCVERESAGVQCELMAGHDGSHACPNALCQYMRNSF